VVSWRVVRLPPLRASVPLWSSVTRRPFLARDEPRAAVAAVLDGPFGEFTVCNTHLSFVPGWNGVQLRRLVRSLDGTREPLVVMGDLNMQARQAARISGLRPIASVATFPADHPHRQLDHVLVRGHLRAAGPAHAVRLPLSDHRALVVPVGPDTPFPTGRGRSPADGS
jgi:endonuclease/exonuclease/phosphatase family metal-dependent hydrolase